MKTPSVRKSGISAGILRRQICAEMVDFFALAGEALLTRGKVLTWNRSFPRLTAYRQAVYRLRRDGLIARRGPHAGAPTIEMTPIGLQHVSDEILPERFWNTRWDGRWYVLMYDVPEKERRYRGALSRFLSRMRMGCLQKSVYVSARDIRPMFYDLDVAAAVSEYANIFESFATHGQSDAAIVARAWDFERLHKQQAGYLEACQARLRGPDATLQYAAWPDMVRAELAAYRAAMRGDPLLPKPLWPSEYLGPQVAAAFRRRIRGLAAKIFVFGRNS